MSNLHTAAHNPSQAKILNLGSSKLTKVPQEIGGMVNLEELNLFRNEIDSVPDFIGNLTRLEHFSVQSNQVSWVTPNIASLKRCKKLNLRFNRLETIPDAVCEMEALEELENNTQVLSTPARHAILVQFMHRGPIDIDFAGCRVVDARDHVQQRGFSTARFADDAHKLACANAQVNAVQRMIVTDRGLVILVDITQIDHRLIAIPVIGFRKQRHKTSLKITSNNIPQV